MRLGLLLIPSIDEAPPISELPLLFEAERTGFSEGEGGVFRETMNHRLVDLLLGLLTLHKLRRCVCVCVGVWGWLTTCIQHKLQDLVQYLVLRALLLLGKDHHYYKWNIT